MWEVRAIEEHQIQGKMFTINQIAQARQPIRVILSTVLKPLRIQDLGIRVREDYHLQLQHLRIQILVVHISIMHQQIQLKDQVENFQLHDQTTADIDVLLQM